MPEVSIIVPVYRAEAYLSACVDSVLNQTFPDFELFLVDDGSPDNCGTICDAYARKDSRIRVIHRENGGQAAARNQALKLATAPWVCFVDSDDLIHPQLVQRLYEGAIAQDAGISLCPMAEAPELPEDFYREPSGTYEVLAMDEATLAALYDREEYPAWVACAKLIRREYVLAHPFCEGRVYEDNEAVCHWVCRCRRLVRLKDAMYYYRTNPVSTTQSGFSLKKLDYLWALEQILRFYRGIGYEAMVARFAHRYAWELANSWESLRYRLDRKDLARDVEKRGRRFLREMEISLSTEDRERMLGAMHPKLIRLYWPVKGAVKTLRERGVRGILEKIRKNGRESP